MAKQLFIERRSHRRAEEAPVERTAEEEKSDKARRQEIANEVAELEATSDEVVAHIDEVLALGLGQIGLSAA